MALRISEIEEKMSTSPGVSANGYQKSISFFMRKPDLQGMLKRCPLVTWYIPTKFLGIGPTGNIALICKLGLDLEELEIKLSSSRVVFTVLGVPECSDFTVMASTFNGNHAHSSVRNTGYYGGGGI